MPLNEMWTSTEKARLQSLEKTDPAWYEAKIRLADYVNSAALELATKALLPDAEEEPRQRVDRLAEIMVTNPRLTVDMLNEASDVAEAVGIAMRLMSPADHRHFTGRLVEETDGWGTGMLRAVGLAALHPPTERQTIDRPPSSRGIDPDSGIGQAL